MTEPLRVMVTGSRAFTDRALIAAALTRTARTHPGRHIIVIHGAARGADSIAAAIAADFPDHLTAEAHPVTDWRRPDGKLDRAAGHRRNARMVATSPDRCLAFLRSGAANAGTKGAIRMALAAGIPVEETWQSA